jgi:V/A-type H+-transporting ATPase subunit G/H
MREIIQNLIAAEQKARQLVAEADEEAGAILAAAQQEAEAHLLSTRSTAQHEADVLIQIAIEDAEKEQARLLEQAEQATDVFLKKVTVADRAHIVQLCIECVCGVATQP